MEEVKEKTPTKSVFIGKTANQTIADAMLYPEPKDLWNKLWYENEACCLFSDSNLGKSILAVQIAAEIAENQDVALFDFELSSKQFQKRYTDDEGNNQYPFSDRLMRYEINPTEIYNADFEKAIIEGIENVVKSKGAKVVIIDNLTYLCMSAEKGDAAGSLMMKLMQLKRLYELSILVLAHTPKRALTNPITQNDLAGSKRLFNFFDSCFAIGKSCKDDKLRYIKQLKCRNGEFSYGSDEVMVCSIDKGADNFLRFNFIGLGIERNHLKELTDEDKAERITKAKEMAREGKTNVYIASQFDVSEGAVRKWLKS